MASIWNMPDGYKSPIELTFIGDMVSSIQQDQENQLHATITQKYGIQVDKEELKKALAYDRNQYQKGFEDARKIYDKPHGEWCEMPTKNTDYISIEKHYYCSLCGEQVWGENEKSNYCPNCGAKMDEKQ